MGCFKRHFLGLFLGLVSSGNSVVLLDEPGLGRDDNDGEL